jgi:hypothetical protein
MSEIISDGLELSAAEATFVFARIEAPSPRAKALLDDVANSLVVGGFDSKFGAEVITVPLKKLWKGCLGRLQMAEEREIVH